MSLKQTATGRAEKIDSRDLRRALGKFLTGVTVVTCMDELGRPRGFTANSFTSVSLNPPLVLVCIARTAESIGAFVGAETFGINILAEHQKPVSQMFASKSPEKFQSVRWSPGMTGAPCLQEGIAWFECRTRQQVDGGDHVVLIGEVVRFSESAGRPLGFCQGNYLNFGLVNEAVDQEQARTIFGCIVNQRERVLLCRKAGDSAWTLPITSLVSEGRGGHQTLRRMLENLNVTAELNFLFSVYEVPELGEAHIFYRGSFSGPAPIPEGGGLEARLFSPEDIPWSDFGLPQTQSMLRRFLREQAADSFGIYMDGFGSRRVARLSGAPEDWGGDGDSIDQRPVR